MVSKWHAAGCGVPSCALEPSGIAGYMACWRRFGSVWSTTQKGGLFASFGTCWVGPFCCGWVLYLHWYLYIYFILIKIYIYIYVYLYLYVYIYIYILGLRYPYTTHGDARNLELCSGTPCWSTRHGGTGHAGVVRATKGSWRLEVLMGGLYDMFFCGFFPNEMYI